MNLIEIIQEEMITDDEDTPKQSWKIIELYDESNIHEKELIDEVFITLCGWSIPALEEMVHESQASIKEEGEL